MIRDLSRYHPLRPGVALSCGNSVLGQELLTTSGVLVENRNKERFITVASHGFSPSRELVFHPDDAGQPIARVYKRRTDSDLAIVSLSSNCVYVNQTLDCVTEDESFRPGTKVTGIRDVMQMPFYEEITINSPFSGFCTGVHIGMEVQPMPSDFPVVPHKWCTSDWWYIGNGIFFSFFFNFKSCLMSIYNLSVMTDPQWNGRTHRRHMWDGYLGQGRKSRKLFQMLIGAKARICNQRCGVYPYELGI